MPLSFFPFSYRFKYYPTLNIHSDKILWFLFYVYAIKFVVRFFIEFVGRMCFCRLDFIDYLIDVSKMFAEICV